MSSNALFEWLVQEGISVLRKKKLLVNTMLGQMLSSPLLENTLMVLQSVKNKKRSC